jgi:hypothetical protein
VQRSSPSIAALATALAKAQIELTNPEKSLIGTIESRRGEGGTRQFRYAPLSSGLEIVRKTLGQHEITTVQTTAIDQAAGIVNLTTVLAHSSGEWIASDWPVCPIAETERPHRIAAMRCSHWSVLREKTISMRRISPGPFQRLRTQGSAASDPSMAVSEAFRRRLQDGAEQKNPLRSTVSFALRSPGA